MIAPPWLSIPPNGYGGIENVIHALVPELLRLGAQVELFTVGSSTVPATKKHYLYEDGQYDHIHKPQYDSMPISVAHLMYAIRKIEEDGTFDVIHDHNGFIGPLVFANHRDLPPIIHTIHGPPFSTKDSMDAGTPDNTPMWRQFGKASKLYFVPISRALASTAPKELKHRMLQVVHNCVNVCDFPFQPKKGDYFMTLARFHPDKGQAIAIWACQQLGYKLKMAGSVVGITEPKKVLLELANPLSKYRGVADFRYYSDEIFPHLLNGSIENVGDVSGEHKMGLIGRARALLFPIQWEEPFGMVAIEALACGTPVVAMARGALPEIIEHGINGFLAQDREEFKHYMTLVDQIDPQVCRDSVIKKFSAAVLAKRYLARYRQVVQKHAVAA